MADEFYYYIILARNLATQNCNKKALDMYAYAFIQQPRIKDRFELEFRAVLARMNEELAAKDNKSGIFANFEKAIKMFPGNVEILKEIGQYLYRYGYFAEALCHFEKVLKIDNNFVSIEKRLNNAKCLLLPRSQFRSLNDRIRNEAYRKAIRSCVTPDVDNVLNMDTGTGLLALYASECNPVSITANEESTTMARLAKSVMQDNHVQEVVITNKPSVLLTRNDICGTPSVLIIDAFDSGIFGKYILESISHAWENLLQDNSKVIPGKAEFFIIGVHSQQLAKKYRLCHDTKTILNVVHMNVHTTTCYDETYCSEDINLYKDLKYISEPQSLLSINFNNYNDVREKLHRREPYIAKLTAKEDGEINMVIGYFNLHLTDEIMVTSDPQNVKKASAWQQATFFDVLPKKLRKKETANISFVTYGGRLTTLQETNTIVSKISPAALAFLNDFDYMDLIRKSIATVCIYLGQFEIISNVDMVDFSPFPMFGVLMLKRGANSLICHVKTVEDKAFLLAVLRANEIPEEKVTILVSDSWTLEVFRGKKFHVIFSNIVDFNGDFNNERKVITGHLKQVHLIPGGLCLPVSVSVVGQLIQSKWLEVNNCVLDENVDYGLAKHVNRYRVSQAMYLDIARTEHETLSEEFTISCCSDVQSEVINVTVIKDGECNAVLCWYKVQLLDDWNEIYTNRSNSFVESMAYMVTPNEKVFCGDQVSLMKCVDREGPFKLVLDM